MKAEHSHRGTTVTVLRWIVLLTLPLLVSCGFQLRGQDVPALSGYQLSLSCEGDKHWHLCQTLRRELELAGLQLVDTSPLTLVVDNGQTEQRTIALTIDADTAEYLVKLNVDVALSQSNNDAPLSSATLGASHAVRSRDTAALKQNAEMNAIHSAIQTQLARDILNWLTFQLHSMPVKNSMLVKPAVDETKT
jgi:outer membrane lipopolysaccharide assembly protein LptE/RlpB